MGSGPLPRWEQQDAESQTVQPGASTAGTEGLEPSPGGSAGGCLCEADTRACSPPCLRAPSPRSNSNCRREVLYFSMHEDPK